MLIEAGPAVDRLVLLGLGLLVLSAALLVLRVAPRLAFVAWALSIAFVPYWLGVAIEPSVPPGTVLGMLVLVALAPLPLGRWTVADGMLLLLAGVAVVLLVTGAATLSAVFVLLSQWLVGYGLGRLVPARVGIDWTYRCLAVVFTVVAVLALAEFATGVNPFVMVGASEWTELQERGGLIRAEGAFGHSIALGACIAMAIPLTLASGFGLTTRLAMVVVMLGATAITFSRIGMVTAALGVLLSVVFAREGMSARLRGLVSLGVVVAGLVLIPLVDETFAAAGDEATGSAAYRTDLLLLADDVELAGLTDVFHRTASGEVFYGRFRSIDSALVLFALNFGWLPLALICALLLGALFLTVTGRATAPTIAIAAQVPAMMTVALITQYAMVLWFLAGLAVVTQLHRSSTASPARPVPAAGDPRARSHPPAAVGIRGTRPGRPPAAV